MWECGVDFKQQLSNRSPGTTSAPLRGDDCEIGIGLI